MAVRAAFIPDSFVKVIHPGFFRYLLRACLVLLVGACGARISAGADLPKPVLVSETNTTRAIAIEPTELRTQPFSPTTASLFYGTDQRTRIMLFAMNLALQPGEDLSAIRAEAEDGTHRRYELKVEALRPVPGQEWISQLTLRLNDEIGNVGDVRIGIVYRGIQSNRVLVGIGHFGDGLADAAGEAPTPATVFNISGRIVDNNQGVPNVVVTVNNGTTERTATTDENGVYTFTLQAYGNYSVAPSLRFFNISPQKQTYDFLSASQSGVNFIAARRLHTIGGQVLDDLGQGLAAMPVTLQSSAPGSAPIVTNTNSEGFFSFQNVPAGFGYTVTPSTTKVFAFATKATGMLDENQTLLFNAARLKYNIEGLVKDGQQGASGITVTLAGGNNPTPLTIATGSGGQFSFKDVAAGYNYTLTSTPNAYYDLNPPGARQFQNLSDNQSITFTGSMRSYAVRGVVTDEADNPLGGMTVLLYTGNLSISKSAVTSSDGHYEFTGVPAAYSYTVGPPSTAIHSFGNQSVGGLPADLTLNYKGTRNAYTLSGVIKDRSNQGVGGVSVALTGVRANGSIETDSEGKYSFANLPAGFDYHLSVARTDYLFEPPARSYYLLKNEQADVTAIRTYKIGGRVTNSNGQGIAGTTMTLSGAETAHTLTASDGSYLFTVTTAGNYLLTPSKEQDFYLFAPTAQSLILDSHRTIDFTASFSPATNPSQVLEFSGSPGTVDYGLFWPEGDSLGHFFWEFWAMPAEDTHTRYLISDGYGGAHALLFGFNYGTGNHYNLYGNIWDGAKANVFRSDEGPSPGEWGHFAVGWDGKNVITYYNGVPVGKQAFVGPRISPGRSWGASLLLIGGSDHQNLRGRIAQVRAYEDSNPRESAPEATFAPQTLFSLEGQFLSYYFRPSPTVADLSSGYNAGAHTGRLRGIDYGYTIECPDCPKPKFVQDPTAPKFLNPGNPGQINAPFDSPSATPQGALISDSFSRNNSTFILGGAGGLNKTEGGSTGALLWQTSINAGQSQPFGILSGHAVLLRNEMAVAWVPTGASAGNLDVRVSRTLGKGGSGANTGLSFRVTDRDNFFFAYTSDVEGESAKPQTLTLGYYQAGVRTTLASSIALPAKNWTILRVVTRITGEISIYADNDQVYSTSSPVFANTTGAGLFNNAPGLSLTNRWDDFTVYTAQ